LDLVWFLASLDRCSGVGGFSSCTKGGRPQDLQEPAWDETKEEKQRAPWAPSLPNLGSSPRATHLQMGGGAAPALGSGRRKAELKEDGGFGLQAAALPELAGSGGIAGGDDPERAAGGEVAQQAAAARERRRRPAGSARSRGRREVAESRRRWRLG